MNFNLFMVLFVAALTLIAIAMSAFALTHDTWKLGRDLLKAAGSEKDALRAIEETRVQRELELRLQRELDNALTYRVLNKIRPFRIVSGGKPIRLEPPEAA
jgi:hypothetical protein